MKLLTQPLNLFFCLLLSLPGAAWAQRVALDTSQGVIVIELAAQEAPKTVANFLEYVKSGHYNNTVFHRVMGTFMIQGGGYTADLTEKPTRAAGSRSRMQSMSSRRRVNMFRVSGWAIELMCDDCTVAPREAWQRNSCAAL